jgi:endo-1,3(4)-beta-glucanase
MLPFTPASEDLLSPAWITDAWSQMSAAAANAAEQSWQGFMYMAHAVIDRATATTEVRRLTGYDDGNSRANTLYWVATRR